MFLFSILLNDIIHMGVNMSIVLDGKFINILNNGIFNLC